jgi:transposase
MPRKPKADPEVLSLAEEVIESTQDAHELRCAQAVLLPIRLGLTLSQTAQAIGRGRATVGRLQAELAARQKGAKSARDNWGGRRRQNLTFEQETEFLLPFLDAASRGGILVVAPVKKAYEDLVGHPVPDSTLYRILARHGWRKVAPDRRHPKANPAAQEDWKKNSRTR